MTYIFLSLYLVLCPLLTELLMGKLMSGTTSCQ